jgi:PKD repeat protein
MKNCTTKLLMSIATFAISGTSIIAQNWRDPLADPGQSFYDVQANFYAEWGAREQQNYQARQDQTLLNDKWPGNDPANPTPAPFMKGGYKQFKRWEYFMEPRCYPTGDMTLPSSTYERFVDYLDSNPVAMSQYQQVYGNPIGSNQSPSFGGPPPNPMSSTWQFEGPTGMPTGSGAGRINCVRFDPTTPTTVYCGAPAGGLWKSTNSGSSWAIVGSTDFLGSIGITDIAIDPTNSNTLYIATGDGDAGDTYSIGVLKSTDGGLTWNTTGLTWTTSQGRVISKLLINPTNNQVLIAFTNNGIYRTSNGGTNWTQVQTTNSFKDGEFQPGNPNVVYGAGTRFWKSTDGGVTWTNTATGLPANTSIDRMAIAVTNDPTGSNYVYILCGSAANDGFYGLYRSTDAGVTFTTRSTTPNVLGWSSTGADTGGQGWYDLSIAASNTSRDVIIVGGVNIWRSTNGGTNWTINGHWTGTGAPYVHADIHDLIFYPGSGTRYFAGCDGGVFETTNSGGAWSDRSSTLCIAQPYRIGLSASQPWLWITGHQDNGTNLRNGAAYIGTMGGDGMDCFIDRTNNNVMYGEQYNGAFNRSTNGGGNWTGITTGLTGAAAWVTPWCQDPATANTLWAGYTNVFRSTNQGTSWTQMGTLGGSGTIVDIKVAPSLASTIYVCRSNAVFKSTNTGGTWTNITGTLPVGSAAITRLMIDPADPNNVWVSFSGYSAANKVFVTTNGGTSWTNISAGLPNVPANCLLYTPGSTTDAIYVGMDVGVYYRDNVTGAWAPYFTGLPNVPIFDLECYAPLSVIRAATYGRGVWQVDIYNPGTLAPVANFTANQTLICPGSSVNFTDLSSFTPTSWSWSFQGGTPATSTAQNPTNIVWSTPGTYSVTLTATNANGSDAETKTAYITVLSNAVAPPLVEGFEGVQFLPTNWTANNINNDGIFFDRFAGGVAPTPGFSARFDNYNYDVAGARDEMWAPRQTFASMTGCQITFDVAYARYDATYTDTLEVMVSTNCGSSWTQVWIKGGTTLATAPDNTAQFVPTAAQWRNEVVSLAAYNGQSNVLIKFVNRGRYGNCLYIDNVNITGTASALPSGTFTASATSVCAGTPVNFTSTSTGSPTTWSWTFPSGTPATATTQNVTGVVWNTAGTYTVTHTATNANGTGTTTQTITVLANPTVTTSASPATICSGASSTLTATGGSTYSWLPGPLSGSPVTVSPASTTTYTVTATAANGCTATSTRTVTVNTTPTVTASAGSGTICSGNSTTLTGGGASTYSWLPGPLSGSPVTVSPTGTTTYTVTGTAANGCTNTQTVTVNVTPTPTVTTTASSTTICSGNSTTLTASGATTYSWLPGPLSGSPVTVSPGTTTTYTVTGTTAGCTGTATRIITVNPTPTVTATAGSPTICSGNSTTLTGGGASTYSWLPGPLSGSPVTVSPASTTTYTMTGTAANGCTSTQTVAVAVNPSPTVTATAGSPTICTGGNTTLTGTGASTYSWLPGPLSGSPVTVSPASTTTYTMTGTAANGCTSTQTVMVTVNPTPTVTVSASPSTICSGASSTMTASGATTYLWMPGSLTGSSVVVSPGATTTYTVTGTSGCSSTTTQLITVNPSPTVTATASNPTICSGNTSTLTGTGATTYDWTPGPLSGSPVVVTPASTTTYTMTGTGANGCTSTQTVAVTVNPSPTVTVSATNSSICTGGSTTLTATGASTYLWMPGSLTGSSQVVTPVATTTYTVTGTAANGCTNVQTITITVGSQPTVSVSASSTSICTGGSTTLTASGTTTYSWMPGSLTGTSVVVTPASSTTYTVTGSNGPGCSNTATILITVNANPTVTATGSPTTICAGSSTTLTGGGASTYVWNPGNISGSPVTVSPTVNTTYTVTGTSAAGCTATATRLITVNPAPTLTVTPANSTICLGGSVTLVGTTTANHTYSWSPTAGLSAPTSATTNASPTVTTTYVLTKTRTSTGCTTTRTAVVTVNPSPTITATAASPSICTGGNTTLTAAGGSTYTWMPGPLSGTTVTVTPVATTTYTVTGTDAQGCTSTQTVTVTVGPPPTVTASSSGAICTGGSATLTGSGATTYTWMPGALTGTSVVVSPASTTTYTVTGSNGAGCSNTATVLVTVNSLPTVSASSSSPAICMGDPVTLTGSGAATYAWMPGSLSGSSVIDNPAASTTYTVTGTDGNGCSNTSTVAVIVNALPTITASATGPVCAGDFVTLTGNGGSTYSWMPGSLSGSPVTDAPAASTTYTVTGTDANGCSNTGTVAVTVNSLPTVTASSSASTSCAGAQITLTGSGAATYNWMPGSMSGATVTDAPTASTTYTVTGTDGNGCSNTGTVAVTVNSLPAVSITLATDTFCDLDGATALSGGSPAGGNYSGPGVSANAFDPSSIGAGMYTIVYTFTDGNGCTDSAAQSVVVDVCTGSIGAGSPVTGLVAVPNPNNGDFTLLFNVAETDDYVLEIHNTLGQVVYAESLNNFSGQYRKEINLSGFERGCYSIRLRSTSDETVIRVITF